MSFQFGAALAVFLAAGATPTSTAPGTPVVMQEPASVPLITPAALKAMIGAGQKFVLVDVREPSEFAAGHIEGAQLMPLGSLETSYGKLPKDAKVVVYCRSGKRSAKAVAFLLAHGLKRVESLEGGYLAWTAK